LKFHTSSGRHYEVKEVTASCNISGSHSGVVAESCVLVQHFVSLGSYRCAPHNDVSVNDGPHTRRWSQKIIMLYYNTIVLQLHTVFSTVTCCTGL